MRSIAKRWLKPLAGLVVTTALLWLLARGLDIEALGRAFAGLSIPILALALTFLTAGYAVRIVRWWWMLRSLEPSLRLKACVWPFLSSIAVNNVMALRAGDALRVFGFRRQLRSPAVRILGTVVIERIMDLVVVLGFFFVGILGLPPGALPESLVVSAKWLAAITMALVLALMMFTPWMDQIVHRIATGHMFAGRKQSEAILDHVSHFIAALKIVRSLPRLLILFGLSVLCWTLEGAVFVTVATALHTGASSMGPWFSLGTGTLATLIPSSPGYVGTFDYFAAQGLAAYGAGPEVSVAFALIVHAVLWTPLTAAGLVYLIMQGTRFWAIKPSWASVVSKK